MKCDQCQMLAINGVPCHETGCPNQRKEWINGQWVQMAKCWICGYECPVGDYCGCDEEYNEVLEEAEAA